MHKLTSTALKSYLQKEATFLHFKKRTRNQRTLFFPVGKNFQADFENNPKSSIFRPFGLVCAHIKHIALGTPQAIAKLNIHAQNGKDFQHHKWNLTSNHSILSSLSFYSFLGWTETFLEWARKNACNIALGLFRKGPIFDQDFEHERNQNRFQKKF